MRDRQDLETRIGELEKRVAACESAASRPLAAFGVRKRAAWNIAGLPFYDIALGPDLAHGELRGHARGVIAVGDIATGVLAVGGLARGIIAIGGLAAGLLGLGGLSIGILAAGGLAIGGVALGGGAAGGVAVGGGAIGYYACGGAAASVHASSGIRRDREAEAFFERYGLEQVCRGQRR